MWNNIKISSLDWKDRVCQTVNMYFVCLSVCVSVCLSVCLLPVFKITVGSVVVGLTVKVFITRDQAESLFFSWLITFAPFSLLLTRRSAAVTHSTSVRLSLCRRMVWNLNSSLGGSLLLFLRVQGGSSSLCSLGRDSVVYTVRRGFRDRESRLDNECWCRSFETRNLSSIQ